MSKIEIYAAFALIVGMFVGWKAARSDTPRLIIGCALLGWFLWFLRVWVFLLVLCGICVCVWAWDYWTDEKVGSWDVKDANGHVVRTFITYNRAKAWRDLDPYYSEATIEERQ
jgi:hypothetical protein